MKKIFLLLTATIFSCLMGFAIGLKGGSNLYFKPNANWRIDNARFAAYFYNGEVYVWVDCIDSDNDGIYEITVPSGIWGSVIFCRMNSSSTINNWTNRWNQTADLVLNENMNCQQFSIPEGEWDGSGCCWSEKEVCVNGIYYDLYYDDDKRIARVIGNGFINCYSGNIIIPETMQYMGETYNVTEIGECAFCECRYLESVTIGNNVVSIGERAFLYSSISSVTIPNSVIKIGDYTFYGCSSLTSITIPNSVTTIGEYVFGYCSSLASITIPNSVASIGIRAFEECSSLTSISIPNSITLIESGTFLECSSLSSIIIPNSVTSIEGYAFENCTSLSSVTIGNSVEKIGFDAFSACNSLSEIVSLNTVPPTIEDDTFNEVARTTIIRVPCEAVSDYRGAKYWRNFTNFRGIEEPYKVSVEVNDKSMGTASVVKQSTCENNMAEIEAKSFPGYAFIRWSDGNTENPRTIEVNDDITLVAEFAVVYNVVVTAKNGYVTGDGIYISGATAISTARAYDGYRFKQWSDGNTDNPREIVVDKDIELTAEFYMPPLISTIPEKIEKGYEGEIIVIFNQTAGNLGMKDAFICYAHTGLVTPESSWKYGTAGWRDGDEKYKMTKNGVWELKIPNIYEFYGCPKSEEILKMAFVFNDGPNGEKEGKTADGGDIFIELVEGTPVDNVTDEQQMVVVDDNRICIVGYSGDYQVYNMSGQLVYSGNDSNVELLKGIYVIRMGEKTQKVVL